MLFRSAILLLAFSALQVEAQTEGAISPQDPNGPCTVCFQDGEEPVLEPDSAPFGGISSMTCDSIVISVAASASLQGSDECKNNQLAAYQLGCCQSPPYFHCPICPDGSDHAPSNIVPLGQGSNPTCAEYEVTKNAYSSTFTTGDCADTFLQRGAFYCGCPDVEAECSLCPDGQRPTNPERGDAWITGSNCEGLEYLLALYKADECTDLRSSYGVDFAHFCKCPDYEKPDTGTCVMCEDGIANPDFVYITSPFERRCEQGADFATSITRENICTREMEEAIALGCKCKNGSGPVFKAAGSSSGGDLASSSVALAKEASLAMITAIALSGLCA